MRIRGTLGGALLLGIATTAWADGPKDNIPTTVRRMPPVGIEVAPADRDVLEEGLAELNRAIAKLKERRDPKVVRLIPDVEIFAKAVHDALTYREVFAPPEITKAKDLLELGRRRAGQLLEGAAPWTTQTGLIVRGYVSRIDGSVQPYGLVIPGPSTSEVRNASPADAPRTQGPYRLDVWFHGRGETLSEVNFLDDRRRQPGTFTPPGTIVLHPYGRYCNAFKFAGEVDVLEAIEGVRRNYRIDDDKISVRGFSMGGAACWQFAVHYADRWFGANPGAGFSETPEFLRSFQRETLKPTSYERALWHLYDCTDYAANLIHCPTVAYSGALDIQKQAADIMADALRKEGIDLLHVVAPGTKHEYHPEAKREVERRFDHLAARGREASPDEVTLVTYTLKYPKMHWVTIDGLGEHWKRARVHARRNRSTVAIETENVTALTLEFPSGWAPFPITDAVEVKVDGTTISGPRPYSDRSWRCEVHRSESGWSLGPVPGETLQKRHNLQGPIDDAFMDSFVFVRPTGQALNDRAKAWVKQEGDRAIEHWRRHFRGESRVKDDAAVTDADIASANLVLWGDPQSNAVLKRIADRLPIAWDRDRIKVGGREFPTEDHALILIYPNPLNPRRYVVLNSGFTYREYDYLNNARQVPKLPDWAVVDLKTPADSQRPGRIVAADFFDEQWQLRKAAETP